MTQPLSISSVTPALPFSSNTLSTSPSLSAMASEVSSLSTTTVIGFDNLERQNAVILQHLPNLFSPEVLKKEFLENQDIIKDLATYIPV